MKVNAPGVAAPTVATPLVLRALQREPPAVLPPLVRHQRSKAIYDLFRVSSVYPFIGKFCSITIISSQHQSCADCRRAANAKHRQDAELGAEHQDEREDG